MELKAENRLKSIIISEDKKTVTINHNVHKHYTYEGNVTSTPEPFDVFQDLRNILENAVKKFNKQ